MAVSSWSPQNAAVWRGMVPDSLKGPAHSIVSEKVAVCCSDPEVAVTVTVEVTD